MDQPQGLFMGVYGSALFWSVLLSNPEAEEPQATLRATNSTVRQRGTGPRRTWKTRASLRVP